VTGRGHVDSIICVPQCIGIADCGHVDSNYSTHCSVLVTGWSWAGVARSVIQLLALN